MRPFNQAYDMILTGNFIVRLILFDLKCKEEWDDKYFHIQRLQAQAEFLKAIVHVCL